MFFSNKLLLWHKNDNKRSMPWKEEKDPYKIWLSEIILQQTRVEQGLAYYNKFVEKYPSLQYLAQANDNDVFKLWEGLGYYSRCKNLLATARYISSELDNIFPKKYEDLLALPGIGAYTAAAISSFAYNLPFAVLDGNVLRVLARFFGKKIPIDTSEGKRFFSNLSQQLLVKKNPALYNQAIMDFGATICKPKLPLCDVCILQKECIGYKKNLVADLPTKSKKLIKRKRYLYFFIAEYEGKIYVKQRMENDIWQNLWEFILIEKKEKITAEKIISSTDFFSIFSKKDKVIFISKFYTQQLTHQSIEGVFVHLSLSNPLKDKAYILTSKIDLKAIAFPRFITRYLEQATATPK